MSVCLLHIITIIVVVVVFVVIVIAPIKKSREVANQVSC